MSDYDYPANDAEWAEGEPELALALAEEYPIEPDESEVLFGSCPACGEARHDWLAWQADGETVECGMCGCRYQL